MKNKLFKLFLVLIMLISFTACGKKEDVKKNEPEKQEPAPVVENNNDALIWEVKSDTATIYLVGSIHVAKEDTYPLQKKLLDAFDASDAIAVEADILAFQEDLAAVQKLQEMYFYDDGTTLKDNISEENLNLFNEYVKEYGLSGLKYEQIELLYLYKPWVLSDFITFDIVAEAGVDVNLGIDQYFLTQAKEKNMEVIEIESVEFQYDLFNQYSPELQEFLLMTAIKEPRENAIEELQEMLELWESGDVEDFTYFIEDSDEEYTEEELKLLEEYNKLLITDRNQNMTLKVEELLQGDKDVFYIVGSAHMVGDEGIVKLLENKGYTVTKI